MNSVSCVALCVCNASLSTGLHQGHAPFTRALAIGARARVPDRFVRHIGVLCCFRFLTSPGPLESKLKSVVDLTNVSSEDGISRLLASASDLLGIEFLESASCNGTFRALASAKHQLTF